RCHFSTSRRRTASRHHIVSTHAGTIFPQKRPIQQRRSTREKQCGPTAAFTRTTVCNHPRDVGIHLAESPERAFYDVAIDFSYPRARRNRGRSHIQSRRRNPSATARPIAEAASRWKPEGRLRRSPPLRAGKEGCVIRRVGEGVQR